MSNFSVLRGMFNPHSPWKESAKDKFPILLHQLLRNNAYILKIIVKAWKIKVKSPIRCLTHLAPRRLVPSLFFLQIYKISVTYWNKTCLHCLSSFYPSLYPCLFIIHLWHGSGIGQDNYLRPIPYCLNKLVQERCSY